MPTILLVTPIKCLFRHLNGFLTQQILMLLNVYFNFVNMVVILYNLHAKRDFVWFIHLWDSKEWLVSSDWYIVDIQYVWKDNWLTDWLTDWMNEWRMNKECNWYKLNILSPQQVWMMFFLCWRQSCFPLFQVEEYLTIPTCNWQSRNIHELFLYFFFLSIPFGDIFVQYWKMSFLKYNH